MAKTLKPPGVSTKPLAAQAARSTGPTGPGATPVQLSAETADAVATVPSTVTQAGGPHVALPITGPEQVTALPNPLQQAGRKARHGLAQAKNAVGDAKESIGLSRKGGRRAALPANPKFARRATTFDGTRFGK